MLDKSVTVKVVKDNGGNWVSISWCTFLRSCC